MVDIDATNLDVSLRSYNPETANFSTLKSAASIGASAAVKVITIPVDPPVVTNTATTSYRLRVAPGVASSVHLLYGARVGYTVHVTFIPSIFY